MTIGRSGTSQTFWTHYESGLKEILSLSDPVKVPMKALPSVNKSEQTSHVRSPTKRNRVRCTYAGVFIATARTTNRASAAKLLNLPGEGESCNRDACASTVQEVTKHRVVDRKSQTTYQTCDQRFHTSICDKVVVEKSMTAMQVGD